MTDFAAARAKMVDSQLRTENVTDYGVLAAMSDIPRERFVPAKFTPLAYIDEDLRVKDASGSAPARYLMEPAPFARLVQEAEVGPTDAVLVVGGGPGYAAAVLSRIAGSVVMVESDAELAGLAERVLGDLAAGNVTIVKGPIEAGCHEKGPYDVILLDGAVETVPEAIFAQLKEGGRLVGIVGYGRAAPAMVYTKTEGDIGGRPVFNAHVQPLPGFRKPAEFVF
jgi:protein-L-isoaspartate(D-aspartate) O-methyltransferase